MKKPIRTLGMALLVGSFAACSTADAPTAPQQTPLFAKGSGGGGGGGGGGTAVPPTPVPTATVTINITSATTTAFAGRQVAVFLIATSEGNNRRAPVVTVASAPVGFVLNRLVTVNSPGGGDPGYTEASYLWTPAREQIGLAARITFVATTSGGSTSATADFGTVLDAPTALTGLTATGFADHIEAHWQPSAGGAGPISYVVSACYRNANIRPVVATCEVVKTTTSTEALDIPLVNPAPSVPPAGGVAAYFFVLVTPRDANGVQGAPAGVNVL